MIPPPRSPPSCTTHRPSTTIGEHDVKNRGSVPLESSLRQTTLPLPASRQERVAPTPSVTTLPSATAGELRVPGKRPAGPVTLGAAYLSCQTSLPVAASRQRVTSSSPWRAKT